MNDSWIRETMELLEDWETEKANLELRVDELGEQIDELAIRIAATHALIQAYIKKHDITSLPWEHVPPGYFANKSYPEMLVEIAQKRQGYLKVADAVEIMLDANVDGDRRAIQANIYSALRRMRKRFSKIAPGEYRHINHARKQSDGKPSGLRQAVKELKEKNPWMTKKEVLRALLRSGFDFKGKKPGNAVNMAWVYLGYDKEEKQSKTSLLTIDEMSS